MTKQPTVEEILASISKNTYEYVQHFNMERIHDTKDVNFIRDMTTLIMDHKALTSNQADLVIVILKKYKNIAMSNNPTHFPDNKQFSHFINNPTFINDPIPSDNFIFEAKWGGNSTIVIRYRYKHDITMELQKIYNKRKRHIFYDSEYKVWKMFVTYDVVEPLEKLLEKYNFAVDDNTKRLFDIIKNNQNSTSNVQKNNDNIKLNIYNNEILLHMINDNGFKD